MRRGETGEKPLGVKERTNNKLNPLYGTRSTVVGEAPPLLSQISLLNMLKDDNSLRLFYFKLFCSLPYLFQQYHSVEIISLKRGVK